MSVCFERVRKILHTFILTQLIILLCCNGNGFALQGTHNALNQFLSFQQAGMAKLTHLPTSHAIVAPATDGAKHNSHGHSPLFEEENEEEEERSGMHLHSLNAAKYLIHIINAADLPALFTGSGAASSIHDQIVFAFAEPCYLLFEVYRL